MKDEVFYKEKCYFSKEALRRLQENGVAVEKEDITGANPVAFTNFINQSTNSQYKHATVPQIWIDGKYIGGCDDLVKVLR